MADQRPFRFRLPWLLAPARTTAESEAPRQARGQPTRPPFRPAGAAQPPRPSTQPPASKAESSQPPPPPPSRTKATSTPAPRAESSQPPPPPSPTKATSPPAPSQPAPRAESSQPPPRPAQTQATSPPSPPTKTPLIKIKSEPQATLQPPTITQSSPPKRSDPPSPVTKTPSPSKTQLPPPSAAETLSVSNRSKPTSSTPSQLNSQAKPTTTKDSTSSSSSPRQQKPSNIITAAWEKLTHQEPKESGTKEEVIKESQPMADSTTKPQSKPMIPEKEDPALIPKPAGPAPATPRQKKSFPGSPRTLVEVKAAGKAPNGDKQKGKEEDHDLSNTNSKQKEIMENPPLPPPVSSPKTSPVKKPNNNNTFPNPEIFQTKDILTASDDTHHPSRLHNKPSMSGGEKTTALPSQKDIKEDMLKVLNKLGTGGGSHHHGQKKHSPDHHISLKGENKPAVSVITLAGENRGASMTLGNNESTGRRREKSIHIHRGYRTNPDESPDATTDDGEESSSRHHKTNNNNNNNNSKSEDEDADKTETYINSNVQAINNSLVFNSSVSEGNPGVQYSLSCNRPGRVSHDDEKGRYEANKAPESSTTAAVTTSAKRLAYTPTVRRRCLRGLFMESSDSEPENPDKPRRHGCRYGGCSKGKNKDDQNIDVL